MPTKFLLPLRLDAEGVGDHVDLDVYDIGVTGVDAQKGATRRADARDADRSLEDGFGFVDIDTECGEYSFVQTQ